MKVAVILTARPSWAKLAPVCRALKAMPDVELQIICCASALLERYGKVVDVVRQHYAVAAEVWSTYEGATLETSAKETGALVGELASVLQRLSPDCAVVCADRHEVLGAAQAASYLHIPLLHLQGGERTGSIDDKVRDSITHLSDYHCVATERALYRVYALTGRQDRIWQTGCPSIDVAKQAQCEPPVTMEELGGVGSAIDLEKPFFVVLHHPITNDATAGLYDVQAIAGVLSETQTVIFWPGQDAGQEPIAKFWRQQHESAPDRTWHFVRNLPPIRFLKLLTQATCLVGNSSAGIRECSYLGVPVINIGTRQHGRERARNVIDVRSNDDMGIFTAVRQHIEHGRYPSSSLYGNGDAGQRIAQVIRGL